MSGYVFCLEAAGEEDLAALVALERDCFSHPWTVRQFRAEMSDAARGRIVVLRRPFTAADPRRGVAAYCAYRVAVDELEILNLAVRPSDRGLGVGRRLLALVLDVATRRGARTALLEVRQGNWPALQLYRSLGFEIVAARRGYYSSPREDALVLRKGELALTVGARLG